MTSLNDKPYDMRNITRMDNPKFKGKVYHAWAVRFGDGGSKLCEYFGDSKYGGKEKALEAAKRFRDEKEKELTPIFKMLKLRRMNRRNKSGVVGVHKADKLTRKRSGKTYSYSHWIASWFDPVLGKKRNKAFSISKYGEAEALRLALKARDNAVALLTGTSQPESNWGTHPLSKLVELVEKAKTSYEKGRSLEELILRVFNSNAGFSIIDSRVQTETEEIDLIVLNSSNDPRFRRESAILLIECKNWSGKCGKNEFVIFKEKIENRSSRCSLGFLISWNGFAGTVTKEMLRGSREQTLVIPIEGNDIKRAIYENNFEDMLIEAWHNAVTI